MKFIPYLAAAFCLLTTLMTACNSEPVTEIPGRDPSEPPPTPTEIAEAKVRVSFHSPVEPSDSTMLIPISTLNSNRKSGDGFFSDIGSSSYKRGGSEEMDWGYSLTEFDYGHCQNFILLNIRTGESHVFTEERIRIEQIFFPSVDSGAYKSIPFHYLITFRKEYPDPEKHDHYAGPLELFVADANGKNPQRISPEGANLLDWKVDRKDRKIYMRSLRDRNGDKEFDISDEFLFTQVSIFPPFKPVPLVNPEVVGATEELMKELWKQVE